MRKQLSVARKDFNSQAMLQCYSCGEKIAVESSISRHEQCPACKAELRCCLNCEFYDAGAYNECREPQAERQVDKEKANFCDYFKVKIISAETSGEKKHLTEKTAAQKALEDLFK